MELKYCTHCGEKLEPEHVFYNVCHIPQGYDGQTGKQKVEKKIYRCVTSGCPNFYSDRSYPETASNAHLHVHYFHKEVVREIPDGADVRYVPQWLLE